MTIGHRPKPNTLDDVEFYSRMLARAVGPSAKVALVLRVVNCGYWLAIIATLGWFASMAFERELPVRQISRALVSTQVVQGGNLQIRSKRTRVKQCELIRRFVVIDGIGRRHDFSPEPFDAFGPIGTDDDIIDVHVPPDASPGPAKQFTILAWDCNPLQRALGWSITVVQPALEFEILKR